MQDSAPSPARPVLERRAARRGQAVADREEEPRQDIAQRWVDHLPENFPAGRIDLNEFPAATDLASLTTDLADQHVCALAIAADADYLLAHERGMLNIFDLQAGSWAGGRPIEDLLGAIERAGAPALADKARSSLNL